METRPEPPILSSFTMTCAAQSGGWLPMTHLRQPVALGAFGQWRQGRFLPLGNIKDLWNTSDQSPPPLLSEPGKLAPSWGWQQGVTLEYRGLGNQSNNGQGNESWQELVWHFARAGSFAFHSQEPYGRWLLNWAEVDEQLISLLTQKRYSFRDVWVIVAVAEVKDWGMLLATHPDAGLTLLSEAHSSLASLSQTSTRLVQSRGVEISIGNEQPGYFFQAKKLIISQHKQDQVRKHALTSPTLADNEALGYWLSEGMLNLLPGNQQSLANCLELFSWTPVTPLDLGQ